MSENTRQITISPKFFKKERDNYSQWSFCFFRELTQNSRDAGASRILISVRQEPGSNRAKTSFTDNGEGMTADVRDRVYFALGETTKDLATTEGGFGKARIVTCFAHHSYALHSQDWKAEGVGASYTCSQAENYLYGCRVDVDVDATDKWNRPIDMMKSLENYLKFCQFQGCNVYVNGNLWTDWCYKNQLVKTLSFADVYANKSGGKYPGLMIIRLRGAVMFTRPIRGKAQVVVEIKPEKAKEVLVSNRDSLLNEASYELDRFIEEICVDVKSALRTCNKSITTYGNKPKVTKRLNAKPTKIEPANLQDMKDILASFAAQKGIAIARDASEADWNRLATNIQVDILIDSAVIWNESELPAVRKIVDSYDPRSWCAMQFQGRDYMKGRCKRDLLRIWTVIVDSMLEEWLEISKQDSITWVPGFIFSESYGAYHAKENGSDTHMFLLNPVKDTGLMKFSLRNQAHWSQMLSMACHEIVHVGIGSHDEDFASALTTLNGIALAKRNDIFRKIKGLLVKPVLA